MPDDMPELSKSDGETDEMSDFIVHDDDDEEGSYRDETEEDEEGEEDEGEEEERGEEEVEEVEEAEKIDDGIDVSNIVHGRRQRKPVKRYEDEVFASEDYQRLLFCDIPEEEMKAALHDEDFSDEESGEEEDDVYEDEDEDEDEDENEEDEDAENNKTMLKTSENSRVTKDDPRKGTSPRVDLLKGYVTNDDVSKASARSTKDDKPNKEPRVANGDVSKASKTEARNPSKHTNAITREEGRSNKTPRVR